MANKKPYAFGATFHPVGPGLFYSAEAGRFRFVYDCGSFNRDKRDTAISQWLRSGKGARPWTLFVSHLHADHVNGLDQLLAANPPQLAFLPYLIPLERARAAVLNGGQEGWYYEFLQNPALYLVENGVGRVVYVLGGEPDRERNRPPDWHGDSPHPREPSAGDILLNEERSGRLRLSKVGGRPLGRGLPAGDTLSQGSLSPRVQHTPHDGAWLVETDWFFRLFVNPVDPKDLETFASTLREILGLNDSEPVTHSHVLTLLQEEDLRNEVARDYEFIDHDLNHTSLVVLHGPIARLIQDWTVVAGRHFGEWPILLSRLRQAVRNIFGNPVLIPWAQLLTGDLDLSRSANPPKRRALLDQYAGYLPLLTEALIPHHGSVDGWRDALARKTLNCKVWSVSGSREYRKNWEHPDKKVVRSITSKGATVVWANEHSAVHESFRVLP